jgi:hypothetical protein
VLLPGLWAVAVIASLVTDLEPCTPRDPSICGPDPLWAGLLVVMVATPLLLMWMPQLGCAFGITYALLEITVGDHVVAGVTFGLHGIACGVVAVRLRRAAVEQERIALEISDRRTASAPSPAAESDPRVFRDPLRVRGAGLALLVAVGLVGWYGQTLELARPHLARAVEVPARIVAVDDASFEMTVDATVSPAEVRRLVVGVLDVVPYPVGSVTPLLVDREDPAWFQLVAEPRDTTGWLSAGLGALLVALVLVGRELRRRAALQLLWTGPHPAVRVLLLPGEIADARVLPVDDTSGVHAVPITLPTLGLMPPSDAFGPVGGHLDTSAEAWDDTTDGHPQVEEEWDEETLDAFGRLWRGELDPMTDDPFELGAEPAVLLGRLRDGGWVLALTDDGVLVPTAPLRIGDPATAILGSSLTRLLARLPFGPWRHAPAQAPGVRSGLDDVLIGDPVRADALQAAPVLPIEVRAAARVRLAGAAIIVAGFVGACVAVAFFATSGFDRAFAVLVGGVSVLDGATRLLTRVRMTTAELTLITGARIHRVAWHELYGVRRVEDRLVLAWYPDRTLELPRLDLPHVGTDAAMAAERLGAAMLRLRDDASIAGAQERAQDRRPGPGWAVVATYVALMTVVTWIAS